MAREPRGIGNLNKLSTEFLQELNWDGDTYIQFINQFIFISGKVGQLHYNYD